MERLQGLLSPELFSLLLILIPTLIIFAGFAYAAVRSHHKHLERLNKIKKDFLPLDDS
jgi:hypothetical protein